MNRRRAVITGVGAVSAFGVGYSALEKGLLAGRSAIGPIRNFDAGTFPTRVAGEVPVVQTNAAFITAHLDVFLRSGEADRWERSGLLRDRKVCFGLIAATEAFQHASCTAEERRAALSLGLGLEQAFLDDLAAKYDDGHMHIGAGDEAGDEGVRFRSRVDLCAQKIRSV